MAGFKFNCRKISDDVGYPKTDSAALVSYQGALWRIFGWTSALQGVWKSTDNGLSWIQQPDFPGFVRDNAAVFVIGGLIYVCGGYGTDDLWSFDGTTWIQISASLGLPSDMKYVPCKCTDGTYIYLIGGQDAIAEGVFNTSKQCYRLSITGVITFMGTIPSEIETVFSGACWYKNGKIIITNGGSQDGTLKNNKTIMSPDNGVTWSVIGTIPMSIVNIYETAWEWAGFLWMIPGNNADSLYYSGDEGVTWLRPPNIPIARHAANGISINDNYCIITGGHDGFIPTGEGSLLNDLWYLEKIDL